MLEGYKGFISPQKRWLATLTDNYVCKIHAGNSFIANCANGRHDCYIQSYTSAFLLGLISVSVILFWDTQRLHRSYLCGTFIQLSAFINEEEQNKQWPIRLSSLVRNSCKFSPTSPVVHFQATTTLKSVPTFQSSTAVSCRTFRPASRHPEKLPKTAAAAEEAAGRASTPAPAGSCHHT